MKPLNKYLNPKSQWHANNEFPEKPLKDSIVNFLKDNGFEEIPQSKSYEYTYTYCLKELSSKVNHGLYIFSEQVDDFQYIYFCKPGPINLNNPIYSCRVYENERDIHGLDNMICFIYERIIRAKYHPTYPKFVQLINKEFN